MVEGEEMKEEMLDVYTDRLEYIGPVGRKEVHTKGMWHQVVACLVINPKTNKAYFQRKRWSKNCPLDDEHSSLDITVGGHFRAGETLKDATREITEELNQKIKYKDLFYLGVRQCGAKVNDHFIANEFHQVFLLPLVQELSDYNVDGEEVGAIVEIGIDEGIKLLKNKLKVINGKQLENVDGKKVIKNIKIHENSFMHCWLITDQFILRLLIASKRYISGENKDLIMW